MPWSPREDCSGSYGAGLSKAKLPTLSLKDFARRHAEFEGKKLRVTAPIQSVCRKKGCWVLLAQDGVTMRIRFKDYKFFLPTNSKGYIATVEGVGKLTMIPEDVARHYAEDAGDLEGAKKIKGPQKGYAFMANGAALKKSP